MVDDLGGAAPPPMSTRLATTCAGALTAIGLVAGMAVAKVMETADGSVHHGIVVSLLATVTLMAVVRAPLAYARISRLATGRWRRHKACGFAASIAMAMAGASGLGRASMTAAGPLTNVITLTLVAALAIAIAAAEFAVDEPPRTPRRRRTPSRGMALDPT